MGSDPIRGEQSDERQSSDPVEYSVFSKNQKRCVVLIIAFAGMFSPLSSFIYYPAIYTLATDLRTSVEAINLTITSYMVVSGITPSILGGIADRVGRRPIYLFSFMVYVAANVGLALQHSFPALLLLRMVQSVGSSATIAIAYGVIGDIAPPAYRGSYVGAVLCGPNVAPSLGPVLGGALAERAGWMWIFWFLTMISGICLVILFLFLPETARNVVGNGSLLPRGIHRDMFSIMRRTRPQCATAEQDRPQWKLRDLNFLTRLPLVLRRDTAPIIWTNAVYYMIYCCVQASLSHAFITIYHYSELKAGLVYLPFGFGCALASYLSGKIMNRDYRIVAEKNNFVIDKVRGDDLSEFPIEHARLRSIWYMIGTAIAAIVGYGWSLQRKSHVAVPLVMQFLIGITTTGIFNICGTFLVDLHPSCPSAISALLNLIRCSLSATGLAVLQIIIDRIGIGWCFTIFSVIATTTIPFLLVQRILGLQWRVNKNLNPNLEEKAPRQDVE